MAYDFFGTFTTAQWLDFKDFVYTQRVELESRLRWLNAELTRIGVFTTDYADDGTPVSFFAPANTYAGKLLAAFRMLGGVPERDMLLRTRDNPVFLQSGSPISSGGDGHGTVYTNMRRDRGTDRYDRALGLAVGKVKTWNIEAIKLKKENLEYKIKRALDYSDQLQQEVVFIEKLLAEDALELDRRIQEVVIVAEDPDRYNTTAGDRFGLLIGAIGDGTSVDAGTTAKEGNQRVPGKNP